MTTNVTGTTPATKPGTNQSIFTGILLCVLGAIAIALPVFSTFVAISWTALILISAGAAKLSYAVQTRQQGGFIWKLLLGILYIATGIMVFVSPYTSILTLTLLLGSFLLTEGVFNIVLGLRLRPQTNWLWAIGDGIVTLLLGALIWAKWPYDAPWLIGTYVGASILMSGISRIMLSLNHHNPIDTTDSPASA